MKKLAILASGSGTNAENIYKFFSNGSRVKVELVIYDRINAGVAARMRTYGVDTLYLPKEVWKEHPEQILLLLEEREIDLVVLAGFLRVVPPLLTEAYSGRMINIHPSLLPAYGGTGMYGKKVHEAVIANSEKESGVTVHYVSDEVDGGEILMQERVEITPEDTAETLEQKIHQIEYSLFPRAIAAALRKIDEEKGKETGDSGQGTGDSGQETGDSGQETGDRGQGTGDRRQGTEESPAAREWAETLGVKYDPSKLPPHFPGTEPPVVPSDADVATRMQRTSYPGNREGYNAQPGAAGDNVCKAVRNPGPGDAKMPDNYLIWSVLMTVLCCLPAGIVAIIFSSQVTSKYYSGDIEGAERASNRAQIWIIVSFVLGVIFNTLYIPISLLF